MLCDILQKYLTRGCNFCMKKFNYILLFLFFIMSTFLIYINYTMEKAIQVNETPLQKREFAIVLGASVRGNELSNALKRRMDVAIDLFKNGFVKSILLSGDGTDEYYSETTAMRRYALASGIAQENLITDEKGYNTYLTMIRAHDIFNAKSAYIISQNFHLVRSVWVARECGIDAQGVGAGNLKDPWYYYFREFFARAKDYIQVKLKL
jgi:SanA protein